MKQGLLVICLMMIWRSRGVGLDHGTGSKNAAPGCASDLVREPYEVASFYHLPFTGGKNESYRG